MQKLPKVSVNKLIKNLSRKEKNKVIFIYGNKKISRLELYNKILKTRTGLLKKGFKNKDKVVCLLDNSYEQIILFLSCISLGIVWVPIEPKRKGIGLSYIVQLVNPKAIFAKTKNNLEKKFSKKIIIVNKDLKNISQSTHDYNLKFEKNIKCILFTSGTTGPPKGVIVSDKMLIASAYATGIACDIKNKDRFLLWESLSHIGGIEVLILCLMAGSKFILLKKFSAKKFWKQIRKYKITKLHYLGGILDILIKKKSKKIDRNHKVKLAFGAGSRKETYHEFKERFNIPLREVYGMTEASSFTTINFKNKLGSIGRVLPWFKLKIVNKINGIGEIVINQKQKGLFTKGYYKDNKSSKMLLQKDGLHTGDLGKIDRMGNVFYIGRLKDFVRVKGENISSWEIETNLNMHSDISESAILSTKADIGEENIIALLMAKNNKKPNLDKVALYFQKKLPKNYNPRYWCYVDKLPRTPTFRIDKKLIKINSLKLYDFLNKKFVYLK